MTAERNRTLDELYHLEFALPLLKLLSGQTRIEILASLAEQPAEVGNIADRMHLDIKAISHQLGELRASRLVSFQATKQHHTYQLNGIVQIVMGRDSMELKITPAHGCMITLQIPRRA